MACSRSLVPSLQTKLGLLRGRKLFVQGKHVNAYLGIKVCSKFNLSSYYTVTFMSIHTLCYCIDIISSQCYPCSVKDASVSKFMRFFFKTKRVITEFVYSMAITSRIADLSLSINRNKRLLIVVERLHSSHRV